MAKLVSSSWSWKARAELSYCSETFQLQKKFSNFGRFFPNSLGSFQLRWVLSNFAWFFPTSLGSFQVKQKLSNFRLSNLKLLVLSNCPFQLHIARSQSGLAQGRTAERKSYRKLEKKFQTETYGMLHTACEQFCTSWIKITSFYSIFGTFDFWNIF